ncbi:MAG: toast rack family protein [Anaerolineales bacterium]
MRKKRGVIASLLILIAVAFAATGCYQGVRVGDLQTKSQTVERGDANAVNAEIQMGAGKLDVSGGASELLEASFTYNVEELDPRATYTNGRLEVRDSGVNMGIASLADLDEFRNEWDLKLNEDVPMEMKINLGAGPSNLALGARSPSI